MKERIENDTRHHELMTRAKSAGQEAREYTVSYYQRGLDGGGCVENHLRVWAYDARDARYQVEVSFEKVNDPYFRVIGIKPANAPFP